MLRLHFLLQLKASDAPSKSPLQTKMLDYHPVWASNVAMMTCFNVIDSKTLETVTQIKPSTCLDILPTNLFKNVFDCLAIDIL